MTKTATKHVLFDVETTGLDDSCRVCEFAGVELVDFLPTGRELHLYCDPGVPMPDDAFAVHGLSDEFLREFPPFASVAGEIAAFFDDAVPVAHNYRNFDQKVLNREFAAAGLPPLPDGGVDTLVEWRRRYPGAPANLDYILDRLNVDRSARVKHGALIDTRLLVLPFVHVMGKDRLHLEDASDKGERSEDVAAAACQDWFPRRAAAVPDAAAVLAHEAFVARIPDAVWASFLGAGDTAQDASAGV